MTKAIIRRDEPDRIQNHETRIRALERRIREVDTTTTVDTGLEVLWSVDGALTTGSSNRYYFESSQALHVFRATLGTAGSTSTVLEIRKNGSAVTTVTLGASVVTSRVAVSGSYATGDYYTVAITQAGTGAEDLQTQAEFE